MQMLPCLQRTREQAQNVSVSVNVREHKKEEGEEQTLAATALGPNGHDEGCFGFAQRLMLSLVQASDPAR